MGGVRVGDLQTEAGEDLRVEGGGVRGGQQHLPGTDGRAAVGEGHGQPGQPVGVDPGQAVVEPPPPVGGLLQPRQPVDRVGQRHPGHAQRAQLHPALQPGGQQRRQHLREDPYGVGARALDHLGVAGAQGLGQVGVVLARRDGGRQEGGAGQPFEDRPTQRAVQFALAERAGHEVDQAGADRAPVGEQSGVGVRRPLGQEVGQRTARGVPAGGVQRVRRDEQGGHAEGFVAGRGRVQHGAGARADGAAVGVHGHRPGHRPVRAQPLLDRPVGEEVGGERAVRGTGAPAGGALPGVLDDGQGAFAATGERARLVPGLDHDLLQAREGEEQGVVHGVQEPFGEVGGGRVAQRQDDGRVVGARGAALGGERQPQQRDVPVAPPDLVAQTGAVQGGVTGQPPRLGQRPAHAAVPADDGGLVGDREDGGEADSEPADGARPGVPLGGGAQRGQRLDAGRVQRGTGVGGDQDAVAQGEPEPSGHARPGGGVGGVLRQLDDEPVAVAAEDEILLGVGVLTEPGRAGGPGVQHPAPQTCRAERVGALGGRLHEHAHGDSPHRRTTKVPPRPARPAIEDEAVGPKGAGRAACGDAGHDPPAPTGAHRSPDLRGVYAGPAWDLRGTCERSCAGPTSARDPPRRPRPPTPKPTRNPPPA